MDKKMISRIQAEVARIKAPGACMGCPMTIYRHLSLKKLKGVGCAAHLESFCKRLGIEYNSGISCTEFYTAFMGIKANRFCKI